MLPNATHHLLFFRDQQHTPCCHFSHPSSTSPLPTSGNQEDESRNMNTHENMERTKNAQQQLTCPMEYTSH